MQLTDKERGWLQRTDDLLYSIMESTSDVIAAVDTDFCYVAFNEAYREEIRCIYGVDIHVGTSIVEAFAHFPEDQKKIIRLTQRALRGESALVTEAYGDPGRSRKYYELRANPIRDANGTIIGAAQIGRDITERKQAEKALRLAKFTISNTSAEVFWIESNGHIFDANKSACAALGYTSEELSRMYVWNLDPNYPKEAWQSHWLELKERRAFTFESSQRAKDGHTFPTEVSVNYLEFEGAEFNCAIVRDITERKRAEEALRESEERYRELVNMSPDAVIVHRGGVFQYANPAALQLHGATSTDQLRGRSIFDFIHPDDHEMITERIRQIKQGEETRLEEIRIIRLDGRLVDVESSARLIHYGGEPAVQVIIRDITERKRAEDTLRESEEKFRALFDKAGTAIFVADVATGCIIDCNRKAEELIGRPRDEIIGMHQTQLHPANKEEVQREQFARHAKGIVFSNEEAKVQHRDGRVIPVMINAAPLKVNGQDIMIGFFLDITERKRAGEALRESEEKFRALAESTNAGIILARGDKFIYVNPQTIKELGYTQDELLAMNFWDVVHPDSRELVRSRGLGRLQGLSTPSTYEIKVTTKNGETLWMELTSTVIDYMGKPAILATIFNITKRKRTEEALKEAKQQAELYLDLMGHDISNMHQIIMGNLELAEDILEIEGRPESGVKEMINSSMATLKRSAKLIGNISNIQKLRLGEYKFEKIDLGGVLDDTVKAYSDLPGRDISISYMPVHDYFVMASSLIKDIFSNLIENAVKHCADPVRIDLSISPLNVDGSHYYRVVVEDNGHGIPDDRKSSLFSRFKQDGTKKMGTGLGLYIVKTLVEGHNGKVWVEDRVKGDHTKGAKFVVMLPAVDK